MKKLLASALLVGLLLGTTSPVFAEDPVLNTFGTDATDETPDGGSSTEFTSTVVASYSVTIPSNLSIDLNGEDHESSSGDVTLDKLTAAGSVDVTVNSTEMTLAIETPSENQKITTKVTDGTTELNEFTLENVQEPKNIEIIADEISALNLPGIYTGNINFTFEYVPDSPTPIVP